MTAASSASVRSEEHGSRIFLRLLADFCRHSPRLKTWLLEDFAKDTTTQNRFRVLVENGELDGAPDANGFAALAGELSGWSEEKHRLLKKFSAKPEKRFGGLTWREMETLIRSYEARSADLEVFLFVRVWLKAGERARVSPSLIRRGAELLDAIIQQRDTRTLRHLRHAIDFFAQLKPGKLRAAIGYTDWWKLHVLLYMLHHPREAYRTRDVRAHLADLGLPITSLDFRRFCKRHCIRRDERAGRPRNSSLSLRG